MVEYHSKNRHKFLIKLLLPPFIPAPKGDWVFWRRGYKKWKDGKGYIQDILNYLSADDRELMLSETCGKCFDKMFPQEEEEEE